MKKSNSKSKAQSAFKKLGAVALMVATMFFTACKQTGGGNTGGGGGKPTPPPTPKPKHAITFGVDGANGTLKAKAEGVDETSTSPITVEEGKTVTFTAEPSTNYKVKEWKVGNTVVTGNKTTTYTHTVKKAVTVKVSFESNGTTPNPPTPTKHTVTLTQTANGKVTASPEIPTDGKMPKDTVITFTAEANAGYKIGKWKVTPAEALQANTGADGSPTAKVKITADTTITVNFEANSNPPNPPTPQGVAILTLDPNKLNITVRVETEDGSAIVVEGCTVTALASNAETTLHATGTRVVFKGKITELHCSCDKLTELNVQGCASLRKLNCIDNKLTSLNVQGLTALQELWCSDNQLTELNVQGLTSLWRLECSNNQLTALNVQGLTALQMLWCSNNKLTALDVSGLTALQWLWCSNNKLTELNVQGCASLKYLRCEQNKLDAGVFIKLFNDLPTREASNKGETWLYTEKTGVTEDNCKDYTQPESLKKAFDGAKSRNWRLQKIDARGGYGNI